MRTRLALAVIVALVAATVFFADHPGHVVIVWRGWQIGTSLGVLIAAAALVALVIAGVLRLLRLVAGSPRALLRRRRERRRRAGYKALTRGMVAVAAGDAQEARRYARRAEALLDEPPLTLLLSAQAAQLGGDELAAKKFFTAMLDRRETEFLGLRGLLNQALRDGDRNTARGLAERAVAVRPHTGWATLTLFELEVRERRWKAARAALDAVEKGRFIAADRARHHRGVILYELCREMNAGGERRAALDLAGQARSLAPDLAPPAAMQARLLLAEGDMRRARRVLERAWRSAPHPELAQVYGELGGDEAPMARLRRFERLAGHNPSARESHLIVAEAALAAELWGEARRHLENALAAPLPPVVAPPLPATSAPPSTPPVAPSADRPAGAARRLCLLMARLEEAEHGDLKRMREWLDRAVDAPPDPGYVCTACGGEAGEWDALCPRCGAFDRLEWRTLAANRGGPPAVAATAAVPLDAGIGAALSALGSNG